MQVKTIKYTRLFNMGNFEHEKFEVEIDVAAVLNYIDASEAFKMARNIVDIEKEESDERRQRQKKEKEEKWAQEREARKDANFVNAMSTIIDDLPF